MEDAAIALIGFLLVAWFLYSALRPAEIQQQEGERILESVGLIEEENYLDGDREG